MDDDVLDDLLSPEEDFYRDGFELGQADGTHAGHVEGKLFGMEKGYEKALEMGRLAGRAAVWTMRAGTDQSSPPGGTPSVMDGKRSLVDDTTTSKLSGLKMPDIPKTDRLRRHIEALRTLTDSATISTTNDDEAVARFDERMARARAKARAVANIVAEPLSVDASSAGTSNGNSPGQAHPSIEDFGVRR
jgi:hypothetical protein